MTERQKKTDRSEPTVRCSRHEEFENAIVDADGFEQNGRDTEVEW